MAEKAWLQISSFEACVIRKYVTKSYYTILSDFGRTPFLYKSTLKVKLKQMAATAEDNQTPRMRILTSNDHGHKLRPMQMKELNNIQNYIYKN